MDFTPGWWAGLDVKLNRQIIPYNRISLEKLQNKTSPFSGNVTIAMRI
jgi:hypothetical protein